MKWSVKMDILNWIMFHTDSILNRRADVNKTFTSKWSYFQQNSCLNLDSCWKLESYCIQDSYRKKHGFSESEQGGIWRAV